MFAASYIAASHLVKRSSDLIVDSYIKTETRDAGSSLTGPQFTVLFFTGLIGGVALVLLQYTFKLLLTLAVVEEPPSVYLPVSDDAESLHATTQPHLVTQENERVFITSSIRGTLRHLRREGGFWAPLRGFGPNFAFSFANAIVRGIFIGILQSVLHESLASAIGGIASMVCLSRFAMVCTHIMISAPESTRWWTRLMNTPWAQAKKTIPAVLIWATALQLVAETTIFSMKLGIRSDNGAVSVKLGFSASGIVLLTTSLLLYVVIAIPATILLIRVQASVLDDDVATIVPFDKTFGQDTSDSDGVLTVQKAINSINHTVFKRVCVFMAKSVPILVVLYVVFFTIMMVMIQAWAK